MRLLLEHGAKLGVRGEDNSTIALTWAAWKGHCPVVRAFIDHGIDVNARYEEYYSYETALVAATYAGQLTTLQLPLDNGSDLNCWDKRGGLGSPLMAAAKGYRSSDSKEIAMKMPLDNGADANACDLRGSKPSNEATRWGNLSTVKVLIDSDAEIDYLHGRTGTPLMIAARLGSFEIVKLLIEKGADVKLLGGNFITPYRPLLSKVTQL